MNEPLKDAPQWTPLTRTEMLEQLTRAADLRSSEDGVLWSIFSIFWAANVGLLIALFSDGNIPKHNVIGVIISVVGVALSVVWGIIQESALGHLKRFERLMKRLEEDLKVKPEYAISAEINKDDYKATLGGRICSARPLMTLCPLVGVVLWLLGTFFFLMRHYHSLACCRQ